VSRPLQSPEPTRQQLGRALRVADAILKVCSKQGWEIGAKADRTLIVVDTIELTIMITETLDRIEADPEPSRGSYQFHYNRSTYRTKPSGQLSIQIDTVEHFWSPGMRRAWRGSDKRPIEGLLASVLRGLQKLADAFRERQEAQRLQKQQEAERERAADRLRAEQERTRRIAAEEKARVEQLLAHARNWHASRTLRSLIRAVQQRGSAGKLDLHGKDLAEWAQWAGRQADRLDPLVIDPASNAVSASPSPAE
jgi:hypothetical protein